MVTRGMPLPMRENGRALYLDLLCIIMDNIGDSSGYHSSSRGEGRVGGGVLK